MGHGHVFSSNICSLLFAKAACNWKTAGSALSKKISTAPAEARVSEYKKKTILSRQSSSFISKVLIISCIFSTSVTKRSTSVGGASTQTTFCTRRITHHCQPMSLSIRPPRESFLRFFCYSFQKRCSIQTRRSQNLHEHLCFGRSSGKRCWWSKGSERQRVLMQYSMCNAWRQVQLPNCLIFWLRFRIPGLLVVIVTTSAYGGISRLS